MRSVWERALAECRATAASDPHDATRTATRLAEDARNDSERLRATLTTGIVPLIRGRFQDARRRFEEAARCRTTDPLARADLANHRAQLALYLDDLDAAIEHAEQAVAIAASLADETPAPGSRYDATRDVPQSAYAAALITRGEIRMRQGAMPTALEDALAALAAVDPRFSAHLHVSALSLLGTVLIHSRASSPKTAREVLRLCRKALQILRAKRVKKTHPHRLKVRGLQGLAYALLGSLERAESLLLDTLEKLEAAGFEKDVDVFVEYLIWIVGKRAGQVGRASMFARRFGGRVEVDIAATPDDDSPIGF